MQEAWQRAFRDGMAPQLPTETLTLLRDALRNDDPRLIQQETTRYASDPRFTNVRERAVTGACLIGFCGVLEGLRTVAEVREFFSNTCYGIEKRLGYALASSALINFWDTQSREAAVERLLVEVEAELEQRHQAEHAKEPADG